MEKNAFTVRPANAVTVATMMQGDCVGHAMLLKALARAAKIPSRAVVGLRK
jgi:transglutaminase-like putative cysteine protease